MIFRLGDICDIYDGPHATPPETPSGPIFLGIKNITEQCELDFSDTKYLSERDYEKWTKRVSPQEDDIVFSYEATLNRYALIPKGFYGCLGRRLAIARVKDRSIVNPHFLYHYFCSPAWNSFILANKVVGSTVLRVSIEDFPNYKVKLPDISIQNSVARALDDIAGKRNNNNAICSTLNSMAKLLYDYWFVQFDFPDKNGKPYKSSGGKMVWNDELKREIPEGWHAGHLGDVVEKYTQGISKNDIGSLSYTPMDIIPMRKMSFAETENQEKANSSLIKYTKYSILFGAMRPYFHRVCIAPFDGITRTTVFTLRERYKGELGYVYETVNLDNVVDYANINHVGTQQPYAEWENNLENCPIPLPPNNLRKLFSTHIASCIDTVIDKNIENRQLASLRDFLLPMLMNGQVKFRNRV